MEKCFLLFSRISLVVVGRAPLKGILCNLLHDKMQHSDQAQLGGLVLVQYLDRSGHKGECEAGHEGMRACGREVGIACVPTARCGRPLLYRPSDYHIINIKLLECEAKHTL